MTYQLPVLLIKSEGWDDNSIKLDKINQVMTNEISQILVKGALEAINIAKILVATPYPPASQPDNPPHMRTGELQNSIDVLNIENFAVEFGSDLDYSYFLEFGTSKMRPRPHMVPAILEAQKLFPELLFDRIQRVMR